MSLAINVTLHYGPKRAGKEVCRAEALSGEINVFINFS